MPRFSRQDRPLRDRARGGAHRRVRRRDCCPDCRARALCRCSRRSSASQDTIRSCRLPRLERYYMPSVGAHRRRRAQSLQCANQAEGISRTRQFTLPDLGEGLEEAEIVAWLVNEGDHVVADQPLVSVETDKAVVEVPSPWSGTIARLFGAKGDLVKVGSALVEFARGSRSRYRYGRWRDRPGEKQLRARRARRPRRLRRSQVLPAVRALARKLEVDLNLVQASGPGGMHHASRRRTRSPVA